MSTAEETAVFRYLTFTLDGVTFAFDVTGVREVLEMISITRIPRTPPHMSGIVNVRGSVVPVIDLRIKLGMEAAEKTADSGIIVVEAALEGRSAAIGVLVDSVQEVVEFDASRIEPPPRVGVSGRAELLRGIGRHDGRFVMIMEIDRVIDAGDVDAAERAVRDAGAG